MKPQHVYFSVLKSHRVPCLLQLKNEMLLVAGSNLWLEQPVPFTSAEALGWSVLVYKQLWTSIK